MSKQQNPPSSPSGSAGEPSPPSNLELPDNIQNVREADQNLRDSLQDMRAAQRVLLHSDYLFQTLVDSVTDYAIYMLDPQGNVVTWNVGAERSKGYKAEEVLGQNYSLFFLPVDVAAGVPARELAEAARTGRYETQAWRRRKDGSRFWALITLTAIRSAEGELHGFAKVTRDMTERKTAEEAGSRHNAQLERFRFIVESVADYVIFTLDAEGRIDSWSNGAQNVLGYSLLEALGQEYALVFTLAEREAGAPQAEMEEAARVGHCTTESWRVRKDGTLFWASGALTAVRDKTGALTGYIRVARDMTAQKLSEEKLKSLNAELQRYQFIVQNVGEYAIYTLDAKGRFTSWGKEAERGSGYNAEQVLGQDYSILFTEEEIEAGEPRRVMEEATRTGNCTTSSWRRRRDGTLFWVIGALTAIRDESGELTGFIRVARDMTAQKQAEEALHSLNAQLQRYRIIVENITDYVIYTMDAEGRIDSWGPNLQKLLGFSAEEVLGREYAISFPEEEVAAGRPRQELEEAARTGRCTTDGWRTRKIGELFWSSGVLTALRDEAGSLTGFIRVARDMTAQKRLEESLAKLAADLELRVAERTRELEVTIAELQRKNQEVEAFVHIVSHDLRAPLVNVQGFVRELEESCKSLKNVIQTCPRWEFCWPGIHPILEVEIADALHYISASTIKFERLINALLKLSRQGRQIYQPARVNVWELATNSVATFRQALDEAGAEVEIASLPSVTADATALGQVFSNLIGNAIKYRSPQRALRIEIGGQTEEGIVHYWVRDNGLGIPEYGKEKLFQVFQRFHSQTAEGEGMGLAIAHRIVERHGGKIWAESREGEGTAFHFSLPASPVVTSRITQG